MFTSCYETSLLCSLDSVTQSEMKVMLLRIVASFLLSFFPFSLSFSPLFFLKMVFVPHSSGLCEEAKAEKVQMTDDSTLADSWLNFCYFF